jgi:hypothetical protein
MYINAIHKLLKNDYIFYKRHQKNWFFAEFRGEHRLVIHHASIAMSSLPQ